MSTTILGEANARRLSGPQPPDPATKVSPKRISASLVSSNLVLAIIGVLFAIPLLWMVLASVDSNAKWYISWPHFTLANFGTSLQNGRGFSLGISVELAVIATLVATIAGTLAAYAFSRRHLPWKGPLLLMVLFLSGVPINIIIIPIYQIFSQFGWLTVAPTGVFLGVTALPFEIWIIKNFIDSVPGELEEAARIEGARTPMILWRLVLPLSAPGIGAAAIFGFINAWGAFLVPLVLISDSTHQPGSVQLYGFISAAAINYGDIAAFSVLYSLPVLALYLIMNRAFRGGFVLSGAIKG
jgi:multiple sugar transport system permease protein